MAEPTLLVEVVFLPSEDSGRKAVPVFGTPAEYRPHLVAQDRTVRCARIGRLANQALRGRADRSLRSLSRSPLNASIVGRIAMMDAEGIRQMVREAFADVDLPPTWALRGSDEGDEPFLLEAEFKHVPNWAHVDARFIDQAPGGFRRR